MNGVPEITAGTFKEIAIDRTELTPFEQDRVHRIRSSDIFVGPLVVVHKSPPAITGRIGVTISEADAVFNETFYGYSPGAFADSVGLTRYLLLILGSKLAIWFALVTSGEVGIEREIVEKATLDRIPLPDFRNFGVARRDEIDAPYEGLRAGVTSWNEVDKWVTRLYGLGPRDLQVVSDTLEFNLPYARNKRRAQAAPTKREQARFCEILEQELRPWCARFGSTIDVRPSVRHAMSPWYGLQLRTVGPSGTSASSTDDWQGLLRAADDAAASEILLRDGPTGMLIGRLAQRRYWSETQARLLAQRIVWSHFDLLQGQAHA